MTFPGRPNTETPGRPSSRPSQAQQPTTTRRPTSQAPGSRTGTVRHLWQELQPGPHREARVHLQEGGSEEGEGVRCHQDEDERHRGRTVRQEGGAQDGTEGMLMIYECNTNYMTFNNHVLSVL